jgi:hypothetical protein
MILIVEPKAKKMRYSDYKGIDAEYYGYNDENDEKLEKEELEAEKKGIFIHLYIQLMQIL